MSETLDALQVLREIRDHLASIDRHLAAQVPPETIVAVAAPLTDEQKAAIRHSVRQILAREAKDVD